MLQELTAFLLLMNLIATFLQLTASSQTSTVPLDPGQRSPNSGHIMHVKFAVLEIDSYAEGSDGQEQLLTSCQPAHEDVCCCSTYTNRKCKERPQQSSLCQRISVLAESKMQDASKIQMYWASDLPRDSAQTPKIQSKGHPCHIQSPSNSLNSIIKLMNQTLKEYKRKLEGDLSLVAACSQGMMIPRKDLMTSRAIAS